MVVGVALAVVEGDEVAAVGVVEEVGFGFPPLQPAVNMAATRRHCEDSSQLRSSHRYRSNACTPSYRR